MLGLEDPRGRAHNPLQCSCLRTPLTEEPGGLGSTGSSKELDTTESSLARSTHIVTFAQKSCCYIIETVFFFLLKEFIYGETRLKTNLDGGKWNQ